MNKILRIKRQEFLRKININLLIILLWFSGMAFSYLIFLNTHKGYIFGKVHYYVDTLSVLSLLMLLASACMFYS